MSENTFRFELDQLYTNEEIHGQLNVEIQAEFALLLEQIERPADCCNNCVIFRVGNLTCVVP